MNKFSPSHIKERFLGFYPQDYENDQIIDDLKKEEKKKIALYNGT